MRKLSSLIITHKTQSEIDSVNENNGNVYRKSCYVDLMMAASRFESGRFDACLATRVASK